jgi:hypothetical protein
MNNGPSLYVEKGVLNDKPGGSTMAAPAPVACLADPCMATDREQESELSRRCLNSVVRFNPCPSHGPSAPVPCCKCCHHRRHCIFPF